jgi:hypothetical protein
MTINGVTVNPRRNPALVESADGAFHWGSA